MTGFFGVALSFWCFSLTLYFYSCPRSFGIVWFDSLSFVFLYVGFFVKVFTESSDRRS